MATVVELGAKVRAKYPGQYDDLDDATLGAKVKAKYPEYADFTDVAPMEGVVGGASAGVAPPEPSLLDRGIQALPAIGGAVGGLVPGPLGIVASGAGQGLGELGRQALSGPVGIENPMGIVQEAGKGAAFGAMGGTVGKAIGGVAKGAFAIGGKVSPKIAKTLMQHGVNISEGKFGAEKLAKVFGKIGDKAKAAYAEADAQVGKSINISDITDPIRKLAARPGMGNTERKALLRHARKINMDHLDPADRKAAAALRAAAKKVVGPGARAQKRSMLKQADAIEASAKATPSELRLIKQRLQNKVSYSSDRIGPITKEVSKVAAAAARKKITGLGAVGKEIAKHDDELGKLKDARRALARSTDRVPGAGESIRLGGGLNLPGAPGGPLAALVDHPQLYSTLALLLNSTKGLANQTTRAAGNLIFPPDPEQ